MRHWSDSTSFVAQGRELQNCGETLSDEEFFVLGGDVGFDYAALLATEHVQTYFDAFHYRGSLTNWAPEGAAEFGAGFVNDFHGAGEDLIGANDLNLQTVDGVGDDAIDFLGLAAGDAGNFGGVAHDAGDAAFRILQNAIYASEDEIGRASCRERVCR